MTDAADDRSDSKPTSFFRKSPLILFPNGFPQDAAVKRHVLDMLLSAGFDARDSVLLPERLPGDDKEGLDCLARFQLEAEERLVQTRGRVVIVYCYRSERMFGPYALTRLFQNNLSHQLDLSEKARHVLVIENPATISQQEIADADLAPVREGHVVQHHTGEYFLVVGTGVKLTALDRASCERVQSQIREQLKTFLHTAPQRPMKATGPRKKMIPSKSSASQPDSVAVEVHDWSSKQAGASPSVPPEDVFPPDEIPTAKQMGSTLPPHHTAASGVADKVDQGAGRYSAGTQEETTFIDVGSPIAKIKPGGQPVNTPLYRSPPIPPKGTPPNLPPVTRPTPPPDESGTRRATKRLDSGEIARLIRESVSPPKAGGTNKGDKG